MFSTYFSVEHYNSLRQQALRHVDVINARESIDLEKFTS